MLGGGTCSLGAPAAQQHAWLISKRTLGTLLPAPSSSVFYPEKGEHSRCRLVVTGSEWVTSAGGSGKRTFSETDHATSVEESSAAGLGASCPSGVTGKCGRLLAGRSRGCGDRATSNRLSECDVNGMCANTPPNVRLCGIRFWHLSRAFSHLVAPLCVIDRSLCR